MSASRMFQGAEVPASEGMISVRLPAHVSVLQRLLSK